jgi:hypothetical protein
VLRIRCCATHQLRPRFLPRPHGAHAHRSPVLQGRSRADSKRILDAKTAGLDWHDRLDLFHSELVLHRLGQLLRDDRRMLVPAHRTHSASGSGAQLGRVLPGEDRGGRVASLDWNACRVCHDHVPGFVRDDHRHVHLLRQKWMRHESGSHYCMSFNLVSWKCANDRRSN